MIPIMHVLGFLTKKSKFSLLERESSVLQLCCETQRLVGYLSGCQMHSSNGHAKFKHMGL